MKVKQNYKIRKNPKYVKTDSKKVQFYQVKRIIMTSLVAWVFKNNETKAFSAAEVAVELNKDGVFPTHKQVRNAILQISGQVNKSSHRDEILNVSWGRYQYNQNGTWRCLSSKDVLSHTSHNKVTKATLVGG